MVYQVRNPQCGNCRNSLSHFFRKNFVKTMVLLKKWLNSWFDEIFFQWERISRFSTVESNSHYIKAKIPWNQFLYLFDNLVNFTEFFQRIQLGTLMLKEKLKCLNDWWYFSFFCTSFFLENCIYLFSELFG